jgi:hypothetical protein
MTKGKIFKLGMRKWRNLDKRENEEKTSKISGEIQYE